MFFQAHPKLFEASALPFYDFGSYFYWNNVLNQQRINEEQRRQSQSMLRKIAKEAIGKAIEASGNKQAELAYNAVCLFSSDNLMEATINATKVLKTIDKMNHPQ